MALDLDVAGIRAEGSRDAVSVQPKDLKQQGLWTLATGQLHALCPNTSVAHVPRGTAAAGPVNGTTAHNPAFSKVRTVLKETRKETSTAPECVQHTGQSKIHSQGFPFRKGTEDPENFLQMSYKLIKISKISQIPSLLCVAPSLFDWSE